MFSTMEVYRDIYRCWYQDILFQVSPYLMLLSFVIYNIILPVQTYRKTKTIAAIPIAVKPLYLVAPLQNLRSQVFASSSNRCLTRDQSQSPTLHPSKCMGRSFSRNRTWYGSRTWKLPFWVHLENGVLRCYIMWVEIIYLSIAALLSCMLALLVGTYDTHDISRDSST